MIALPRRRRRRHRHRDVHADLRPDQQADGLDVRPRIAGCVSHAHRRPRRRQHAAARLGDRSSSSAGLARFPIDPFFFLIGLTYALSVVLPRDAAGSSSAIRGSSICSSALDAHARVGVHLRDRRHHQLLLVALPAADHRREHDPVPPRRAAGRDAERDPVSRRSCSAQYLDVGFSPLASVARWSAGAADARRSRSTRWRSTCSGSSPWRCSPARWPRALRSAGARLERRVARDRRPAGVQRVRHRQPAERSGRRPTPTAASSRSTAPRRAITGLPGGAGDRPRRRRGAAAAARSSRRRLRDARRRRAAQRVDHQYRTADGRLIDLGLTATTLPLPDGRQRLPLHVPGRHRHAGASSASARMQQRLAAVGEMAAGIAHEIRNPLASMSGSIQVLRQELPLSDEQAQLMDIVLRESERLNDTIRVVPGLRAAAAVAVARLDVGKVVQDTATLLRNSAEVRRATTSSTSTCPPSPCGSRPTRTRSGRSSGIWRPTGCARCRRAAACCCRRRSSTTAAATSVVLDGRATRGAAFPPDELDGIFQPFRSSFEKGTGLGLAIVHRIVTDYSGAIQVSSTRRQRHDRARAAADARRSRPWPARRPCRRRRMPSYESSRDGRAAAAGRAARRRVGASRASSSSTTSRRCARCCASCCAATATRC